MAAFRQLSRFGFVGILATAVHVGAGLGLHEGVGMGPLWANLIAFGCALGVSFLGQTRLTFPDSTADGGTFVRFAVVAVSGLGLNQSIVWLVTSVFARPYWLALVIVIFTVPGITFLLLKFWALKR
ncbi:MAG: GtrA family protein [Proteobacteria bacterium]|nr:GtrA family protein [Pseudomonadota bacterium]